MRLRSVEMRNFRAFEDTAIQFEPSLVLIGTNNSGKTSVLDAVSRLFRAQTGGRDDRRTGADPDEPTEIKGRFDSLTDGETEALRPALSGGELTLVWQLKA